jgi:hypothetical protein
MRRNYITVLLVVTTFTTALSIAQTVNVLTWHNDIGRTGQNTSEPFLTYSSVTKSRFGKICSAALDGKIYGQPLVVTGVNFNNP